MWLRTIKGWGNRPWKYLFQAPKLQQSKANGIKGVDSGRLISQYCLDFIFPRTHWCVCWLPRRETTHGQCSWVWAWIRTAWSQEQNAARPSSPGSTSSTKTRSLAMWGEESWFYAQMYTVEFKPKILVWILWENKSIPCLDWDKIYVEVWQKFGESGSHLYANCSWQREKKVWLLRE